MAWIALIAHAHMPYRKLIAPMTVAGIGFSMALPALTKAVVGAVATQDIGTASGAFSTMRQLGGAFGVAILVATFAATGHYGSAHAFSNGFAPAIAIASILALAGAAAASRMPHRSAAPQELTQANRSTPAPAATS